MLNILAQKFFIYYTAQKYFFGTFSLIFPLRNSKKLLSCHNLIEKIQFSKKKQAFSAFFNSSTTIKKLDPYQPSKPPNVPNLNYAKKQKIKNKSF